MVQVPYFRAITNFVSGFLGHQVTSSTRVRPIVFSPPHRCCWSCSDPGTLPATCPGGNQQIALTLVKQKGQPAQIDRWNRHTIGKSSLGMVDLANVE